MRCSKSSVLSLHAAVPGLARMHSQTCASKVMAAPSSLHQ
jgi:hypothetical protein